MAKKITEVPEPVETNIPEVPEAEKDAVSVTPVKEYSFSVKVQGYVRVQAPNKDMAEQHVRSMTLEEFAENRAKIMLVGERVLTGDNI
jgi:hypothetical protein